MSFVEVPWQKLSQEALLGLIEEFITRDGTDYGVRELSLEDKTDEAMARIKKNTILIIFDETTESCQLIHAEDRHLYVE